MTALVQNTVQKVIPSKAVAQVKYAIRDIVVLAQQLEAEGKAIQYLNIGDPVKFGLCTPPVVLEAVERAMRNGHNGYSGSSGVVSALDAIREDALDKGFNNVGPIFITQGVSEAIDLSMAALLNPGDEVLLPAPGYPLYNTCVHKVGGQEVSYRIDESKGWLPDLEDMLSKITRRTRAIVVINPNNPTGTVYPREMLVKILDIARDHHLVVFSDEIYDGILFDGAEHVYMASLCSDVPVITFNGLSKNFLAPGFRMGWAIFSGPLDTMDDYADAFAKLTRSRLSANHPIQHAIPDALAHARDHLPELSLLLKKRRDAVMCVVDRSEVLSCVRPQGAFYEFVRYNLNMPDETFVKELLKARGVAVVHGSGFSEDMNTQHFRVVSLADEETLTAAMEKIADFAEHLREKGY